MNEIYRKYKGTAGYCKELGVSRTTLWRWLQQSIIDKPEKVNGRNYWPIDAKPKFDAEK